MNAKSVIIELPSWAADVLPSRDERFVTDESRMRLALDVARRNVETSTGGPFGAAVFERETGRLVSIGMNLVVARNCSILHAEMVAIAFAQSAIGSYDLSAGGLQLELVSSVEPCAMCFGAVHWSGVTRLVCGGRDEDARAIGFDEGPKRTDWQAALEARGISVTRDILREEAIAVLRRYLELGGPVYNPSRSDRSD